MDRLGHIGDESGISKGEAVELKTMRGCCVVPDPVLVMLQGLLAGEVGMQYL